MRQPTPHDHQRRSVPSRAIVRRRSRARPTLPGWMVLAAQGARLAAALVAGMHHGGRRWFWLVVPALAVALTGSAQVGHAPLAAHRLRNASGIQGIQLHGLTPASGSTTQVVSWTDTQDQTALTIGLGNFVVNGVDTSYSYSAVVFTFTLPDRSTVTVQDIDPNRLALISALLNNLGSADIHDPSGVYCGDAQFQLPDGSSGANGALIRLQVGQGGLVGYAGLEYPASLDGSHCPGAGAPNWEVSSGCTAQGCTPPPPPASAASAYASSFASAVRNADWRGVYALNSTVIRAQYSPAQFAAQMQRDAAQFGTITSISDPMTPPIIQFLADGQAYFVATQNVAYTLRRQTLSREVTSYFLLEGGQWHFWFSM